MRAYNSDEENKTVMKSGKTESQEAFWTIHLYILYIPLKFESNQIKFKFKSNQIEGSQGKAFSNERGTLVVPQRGTLVLPHLFSVFSADLHPCSNSEGANRSGIYCLQLPSGADA